MLPTLNPRPNSDLGILVPHSGSIPGLKSRLNLGLGTSVPYISPPLIRARLSGRIKESTRYFCSESLTIRNSCGHNIPLMLFSKDALFWCARFSCHYFLTVHEPGLRTCQLSLAFVRAFFVLWVVPIYYWLNVPLPSFSPINSSPHVVFSLFHFLLLEHILCRPFICAPTH